MENIPNQQSAAPELNHAPGHSVHDEWIRVRQVVAQYNIGRSFLYCLLDEGVLKSVSVRRRGCIKGIRLISRPHLEEYLSSLVAKQNAVHSLSAKKKEVR